MFSIHHLQARDTIRWGMIGCGSVTEVKSGPALQKANHSQLVAVMGRNSGVVADYAKRHDIPRWYDDADALISDPEVDIIYIATSPDVHESYALKVAAAGKPAYVEKPMARTASECERMIAAFEAARLPLFVAYYRRGLSRFTTVADLIASGSMGAITGINYRMASPKHEATASWRTDAERSGGGLFLDVGSHVLDIIDHLFGPLHTISGIARNLGGAFAVEDSVAASFLTKSGIPCVASFNFASRIRDETLRISGTEGELELSVFGDEALRLTTAAGEQSFHRPNPPHIQQPLIQSIVDELRGLGNCPSTGTSACRTSRVMDEILNDYYGGRQDEFWKRAESWPGYSPHR